MCVSMFGLKVKLGRACKKRQDWLTVHALDLGNARNVARAKGVSWSGKDDEQDHAPEEGRQGRHLGGRHDCWYVYRSVHRSVSALSGQVTVRWRRTWPGEGSALRNQVAGWWWSPHQCSAAQEPFFFESSFPMRSKGRRCTVCAGLFCFRYTSTFVDFKGNKGSDGAVETEICKTRV